MTHRINICKSCGNDCCRSSYICGVCFVKRFKNRSDLLYDFLGKLQNSKLRGVINGC